MSIPFLTISIPFNLLIIVLMSMGIYRHVNVIKENKLIDSRNARYSEADAKVQKCIIKQIPHSHSGNSTRGGYDTYTYSVYLDFTYVVDSETYGSFGKHAEDSTLGEALMRYASIGQNAPLYYQQSRQEIINDVFATLTDYNRNSKIQTEALKIKYLPDNPNVNELNTYPKNTNAASTFLYLGSFLFVLLYLLFSYLARFGKLTYMPLLISALIILTFTIIHISTGKVSIDRKPLAKPYIELDLGKPDFKQVLAELKRK